MSGSDAKVVITLDDTDVQKGVEKVNKSLKKVGEEGEKSTKQVANAMRMLPAQFSDIAVQLQQGTNPFTILLQQGSQIKDSFGGVRPMFAGLASLITPFSVAATGAAVAVGSIGYQLYQASQREGEFRNALQLTGNYAGLTTASFSEMAGQISATANVSKNAAKEIVNTLAATGTVRGGNMASLAIAAQGYASLTGTDASKAATTFAQALESPTKGAASLNAQLHFLTLSQYEQIAAAEKAGEMLRAQGLLADALADKFRNAGEQAGFFKKAYLYWSDKLTPEESSPYQNAMDEMARVIARRKSLEKSIGDDAEKNKNNKVWASYTRQIEDQKKIIAGLNAQDEEVKKRAENAANQQAAIAVRGSVTTLQDAGLSKQKQLNKALDDYYRRIELIRKANKDAAEVQPEAVSRGEKAIRDKYKDSSSSRAEDVYQREVLKLTKEIAAADVARKNAAEGINTEDGKRAAAMRAWLADDKEALKLKKEERKELEALAVKADEAARVSRIEVGHYQRMDDLARSLYKTERDILAIRLTGSGAKYTNADDFAESKAGKELSGQNLTQYLTELDRLKKLDSAQKSQTVSTYEQAVAQQNRQLGQQIQLLGLSAEKQKEMQSLWVAQDRFDKATAGLSQSDPQYKQAQSALEVEKAGIAAAAVGQKISDMDVTGNARKSLQDYADEAAKTGKAVGQAMTSAMGRVEDTLVNAALTGKLAWKDMTTAILSDIARIIIRQQMAAGAAYAASLFPSANGNAFGQGGHYAFAKGGAFTNQIFSQPTYFQFAKGAGFATGVMGEAGDEAVMPLARDSAGRLGVRSQGAGGGKVISLGVTTHYHAATGESSTQVSGGGEQNAAQLGEIIDAAVIAVIDRESRPGGMLYG